MWSWERKTAVLPLFFGWTLVFFTSSSYSEKENEIKTCSLHYVYAHDSSGGSTLCGENMRIMWNSSVVLHTQGVCHIHQLPFPQKRVLLVMLIWIFTTFHFSFNLFCCNLHTNANASSLCLLVKFSFKVNVNLTLPSYL